MLDVTTSPLPTGNQPGTPLDSVPDVSRRTSCQTRSRAAGIEARLRSLDYPPRFHWASMKFSTVKYTPREKNSWQGSRASTYGAATPIRPVPLPPFGPPHGRTKVIPGPDHPQGSRLHAALVWPGWSSRYPRPEWQVTGESLGTQMLPCCQVAASLMKCAETKDAGTSWPCVLSHKINYACGSESR